MIFRFYFFTFFTYFKRKNLDSTPWFKAISLVSLSYLSILLCVAFTFRKIYFPDVNFNLLRILNLMFEVKMSL
jgi:hypothetical protein